MADIIKNNVVDCIEDVKRQCVEIQCNGNVAGEEVVAYLKSLLPDGVIKNIEYTFGTRDFEVETYTAAQTKELNAAINKILDQNNAVSNFDPTLILSGITSVLDTAKDSIVGVWDSKNAASVEKSRIEAELALELAKNREKSKKMPLYIGIGVGALALIIVIAVILK